MAAMELTRTHRILIGVVVTGAVIIAAIGFAGSYAAVRELAELKGFGAFSLVFPIGIDAGICVLLALDLLLTWMRIPFPLLRQSAWLLTAATIAFNGAAAWPDPLGVGMHAVIPLLFIVSVEAARHAVGRIADITADKHMEGVRLTRWLLSPIPTFMLWRRMKLWELRSYEQVIKLEQDRLIYQSRLQARFGRNWKRKAPVEALMPLRLAKYGVPLADTAHSGLAAAGIEPVLLPPAPTPEPVPVRAELPQAKGELTTDQQQERQQDQGQELEQPQQQREIPAVEPARLRKQPQQGRQQEQQAQWDQQQTQQPAQQQTQQQPAQQQPQQEQPPFPQQAQAPDPAAAAPAPAPSPAPTPATQVSPWFAAPQVPEGAYEGAYNPTYIEGLEPTPVMVPSGPEGTPDGGPAPAPGRNRRPLSGIPGQASQSQYPDPAPQSPAQDQRQGQGQGQPEEAAEDQPVSGLPDDMSREEAFFSAFRKYTNEYGGFPNARQFAIYLMDLYGITGRGGNPLSENSLKTYLKDFGLRYQSELDNEFSA
ncbi:DUF2637 domain-containing protein [Streptomyces sp. NPDC059255]|uniref:DUF2637 domain-containing protein n=1 Tax=Streptomyces sp. NPDC059255 TaxID=3346793 RepID=UPI0036B2B6F2